MADGFDRADLYQSMLADRIDDRLSYEFGKSVDALGIYFGKALVMRHVHVDSDGSMAYEWYVAFHCSSPRPDNHDGVAVLPGVLVAGTCVVSPVAQ